MEMIEHDFVNKKINQVLLIINVPSWCFNITNESGFYFSVSDAQLDKKWKFNSTGTWGLYSFK